VAKEAALVCKGFKTKTFLDLGIDDLESLSLMQRLRRMTESLHAALPGDFRSSVKVLRLLAPRVDHNFVSLVLPDYVALYGLNDFTYSMDALKFFTIYGSSEFAVRPFIRKDLIQSLVIMEEWSRDEHEAVRRLASEGCRPRLPWSFKLEALVLDPSPAWPILNNLKKDPSLYVRKSVANHLNDITKDHPRWVLDRLKQWPLENTYTQWIVKHALRTLIKKGDRAALSFIGAGSTPRVMLDQLSMTPKRVKLGQRIALTFRLQSTSPKPQKLVVDYSVHYVKKSGATSAKVFKLKELTLQPGESIHFTRGQHIRDFTTRTHYSGIHIVEVMINGKQLGKTSFELVI